LKAVRKYQKSIKNQSFKITAAKTWSEQEVGKKMFNQSFFLVGKSMKLAGLKVSI